MQSWHEKHIPNHERVFQYYIVPNYWAFWCNNSIIIISKSCLLFFLFKKLSVSIFLFKVPNTEPFEVIPGNSLIIISKSCLRFLIFKRLPPDTDSKEDLNRWHSNVSTAAATFRLGGSGGGAQANAGENAPEAEDASAATTRVPATKTVVDPNEVNASAKECTGLMIVGVDETEVRHLPPGSGFCLQHRQVVACLCPRRPKLDRLSVVLPCLTPSQTSCWSGFLTLTYLSACGLRCSRVFAVSGSEVGGARTCCA